MGLSFCSLKQHNTTSYQIGSIFGRQQFDVAENLLLDANWSLSKNTHFVYTVEPLYGPPLGNESLAGVKRGGGGCRGVPSVAQFPHLCSDGVEWCH